jgi:dephospho-CoA kinase
MLRIGITGIIGSGKTTVCKIFEVLGIQVYYADKEAKKLYSDPEVKKEIRNFLGNDLFDNTGNVDLQKLADLLFEDKNKLIRINQIIHPRVKTNFEIWAEQQSGHSYILFESALLFESIFNKQYNYSITVSSDEDLCIKRVMARDQLTQDQVKNRMKHQLSNAEKTRMANYVIINNDKKMLIPQVNKIHQKLIGLA